MKLQLTVAIFSNELFALSFSRVKVVQIGMKTHVKSLVKEIQSIVVIKHIS